MDKQKPFEHTEESVKQFLLENHFKKRGGSFFEKPFYREDKSHNFDVFVCVHAQVYLDICYYDDTSYKHYLTEHKALSYQQFMDAYEVLCLLFEPK